MSRSDRKMLAVKVAEAVIASAIIWFVGWLMYDLADLWNLLSSAEFQHLLLTLITIAVLASFELAKRSLSVRANSGNGSKHRANSPKPQCSIDPRIDKMQHQLNEISEKLADLHAFDQIKKKRRKS
jgi:hypothetical protein